jgi:hypothetical protein
MRDRPWTAAAGEMRASAESPVATTTLRACHEPASVSTLNAVRDRSTALNRDMLVHGRADRVGVAAEVVDEDGAAEIAVRVGMRCAAVQPVEPVGREQVERVPSFRAPALADPAPVEDGVPVAGAREVPAERQPCLTGADDERFGLPHARHDQWRLGWRPAATSPRNA